MRFLFVHQNFPAQFVHLAPALVARGHEVAATTLKPNLPQSWQGVRLLPYEVARGSTPGIHPWIVDLETQTIRAEAAFRAGLKWKAEGLEPDVIVAHPGWGESMFLKDVWPNARVGLYCEYYYQATGGDFDFDPEFPLADESAVPRIRMKNVNNMLQLAAADAGIAATRWQASTFPQPFRERITVVHDGIDTAMVAPTEQAQLKVGGQLIARGEEVITFVNRNLEPGRGYHVFMRSLPRVLAQRPNARVLIVGGTDKGYGQQPPAGTTWRDHFLAEVRPQISEDQLRRIHFLGRIPYEHYLALLQVSTVHVYLTYPFVLGWSLLEAMSAGCAIVASDTPPLREAIEHGRTGRLVDFFDPAALASEIVALLGDPQARAELGRSARAHIVANYDLRTQCLPRQVAWAESL
jgi:glycosyltransferase involved in cell wall biosynthesis